jgi:hypothetical protein
MTDNENMLIEMASDFKDRMTKKNEKISKYMKIIFMIYGLCRRGLETEEMALFEECRAILSEFFEEEFDLE